MLPDKKKKKKINPEEEWWIQMKALGKYFLIHLSLAESLGAYEMKIHLVWFADFSYSFVSTFKKVFFRS